MGIIYCVRNAVNGKRYIGQTKNSLKQKRCTQIADARRGDSQLLFAAIREFGEDAFEWTVLFDDVDEDELNQLEIDTIAVYRTQVPNGYNLMTGGRGGGRHSEETKRKMSETQKKEHRCRKPPSEETRKKMSEGQRRRGPRSEETRKKMSDAKKNISLEIRAKLSEAAKKDHARRRAERIDQTQK